MTRPILESIRSCHLFMERNLIDGSWIAAEDGRTIAVRDPSTGDEIGTVPLAGTGETRRAIAAAERAFPLWANRTAGERGQILHEIARSIRDNATMLADMLTLEQGKPIAEARGEVEIGAAYIQWFAEEARRVRGDVIPSPWADRRLLVVREPVGVVGAITPWNFPFAMGARKLGAALAAGCTIVMKPSELTPFCGLAWGALTEAAGVPAGVVNIVTGDAPAIGTELTSNTAIRKITFTGSTRVGKLLCEQAARSMKRVSMELGGNAPFIVFADADLDRAVDGAMIAKFRNSGQTCVCTNRFYVEASIYDVFAERLAGRVAALSVGQGWTPGVQQGPLITEAAVEKVEAHVADAIAKGGRILTGGRRHAAGTTFYEPTVITGGHASMAVAREETFGPLAVIIPFESEADVIRASNDTEFGLAAYVYTRDLARTFRMSAALHYGMIGINDGVITSEVIPFGGVKESGMGREGSHYGLNDYLEIKYISIGMLS